VRIIQVRSAESKPHHDKLEQIFKVMSAELGGTTSFFHDDDKERRVYLAVVDKRVVGCLVAESVDSAYELVDATRGVVCSADARPAALGVEQVWVEASHRRRKLATALLDATRAHFSFGAPVPRDRVAFSNPTADGLRFVETYAEKPLLYTPR